MDYEETDKAALKRALLALRQCPRCRHDLTQVRVLDDVWACMGNKYPAHTPETWYLPTDEKESEQ